MLTEERMHTCSVCHRPRPESSLVMFVRTTARERRSALACRDVSGCQVIASARLDAECKAVTR